MEKSKYPLPRQLYIISGVPGSGKSTLARALIVAGLADRHYEADQFFVSGTMYKFDPTKITEAHEWCMNQTWQAMRKCLNVVVSNTFTKDVFLKHYLDMAREYEYNVVEIVMKSKFKSEHDVPLETVARMKLQLQERLNNDWVMK